MELKKDLTQLIIEYLRDGKNNRDEILFYLATTENPSVKLNIGNPLSTLEGLCELHDKLHNLVWDTKVEFEGVSGAFTIHITNTIHRKTLLKKFKFYTIGFEETYPRDTSLLDIKYIFNIVKQPSGEVVSVNLDELY